MSTLAEEGSRAVEAAADLIDLLRLSHEAVQRIKNEVHAETFDTAEALAQKIHELREEADMLNLRVWKYVKELESKGNVA